MTKTDKTQLQKFKDKARELECDNDEARFKERLGVLVKKPPQKGKVKPLRNE